MCRGTYKFYCKSGNVYRKLYNAAACSGGIDQQDVPWTRCVKGQYGEEPSESYKILCETKPSSSKHIRKLPRMLTVGPSRGGLSGGTLVKIVLDRPLPPRLEIRCQFGDKIVAAEKKVYRSVFCPVPAHEAGVVKLSLHLPDANATITSQLTFEYCETSGVQDLANAHDGAWSSSWGAEHQAVMTLPEVGDVWTAGMSYTVQWSARGFDTLPVASISVSYPHPNHYQHEIPPINSGRLTSPSWELVVPPWYPAGTYLLHLYVEHQDEAAPVLMSVRSIPVLAVDDSLVLLSPNALRADLQRRDIKFQNDASHRVRYENTAQIGEYLYSQSYRMRWASNGNIRCVEVFAFPITNPSHIIIIATRLANVGSVDWTIADVPVSGVYNVSVCTSPYSDAAPFRAGLHTGLTPHDICDHDGPAASDTVLVHAKGAGMKGMSARNGGELGMAALDESGSGIHTPSFIYGVMVCIGMIACAALMLLVHRKRFSAPQSPSHQKDAGADRTGDSAAEDRERGDSVGELPMLSPKRQQLDVATTQVVHNSSASPHLHPMPSGGQPKASPSLGASAVGSAVMLRNRGRLDLTIDAVAPLNVATRDICDCPGSTRYPSLGAPTPRVD
eukprot:CAMPEP_0196664816 /NCGR_PEP_ID=MMETSP1086-20130531/58495_1 /TAXON_ID=77921 /ORGANISM="Cyanoptyche  gloeocystis , Strain SAG4.97" /LENGTH=614 /DNA_ID=CAMNT_0042001279 /DNA_START=346 /DNA_END=2187 /DNA_ORIENTATION=-